MRLRAAIFDLYGTLLEEGAASNAGSTEAAWEALHREFWQAPAVMTFHRFAEACRALIDREHLRARALGVGSPEVSWPHIVAEVIPGLGNLPGVERSAFLKRLASVSRSLRFANGAGDFLRTLQRRGVLLGIASNAQAYSQAELSDALGSAGLELGIFHPFLCFWSFENGFSKPNPHVFRLLTARLLGLGIRPSETLMVGDRLDNDIEPARAFGWRTWHRHPAGDGSWDKLTSWLDSLRDPSTR